MLKVLQYSWAITAIIGFGIALYNLVVYKEIIQAVYMPLALSISCFVLFFLFKNQEKFSNKTADKNEQ
jgi:hypothetical protein